jgi:hypothetical protein
MMTTCAMTAALSTAAWSKYSPLAAVTLNTVAANTRQPFSAPPIHQFAEIPAKQIKLKTGLWIRIDLNPDPDPAF